jgi:hypothetical protein
VRLHATKGVPLTCLCYSSYRPTAYDVRSEESREKPVHVAVALLRAAAAAAVLRRASLRFGDAPAQVSTIHLGHKKSEN